MARPLYWPALCSVISFHISGGILTLSTWLVLVRIRYCLADGRSSGSVYLVYAWIQWTKWSSLARNASVSCQCSDAFLILFVLWSQQSWVSCSWAAVLLDVVLNRSFSVHSLSSSDQISQLWRLATVSHKAFKILLGVFFLLSSFCHLPHCDHDGLKLIFNVSVPCIS